MDLTYTITIEDETGSKDYEVLLTFEYNDTDYAALIPEGEEDPDEILLYRYSEGPHGEPEVEAIEDEKEFEEVSEVLSKVLEQLGEEE